VRRARPLLLIAALAAVGWASAPATAETWTPGVSVAREYAKQRSGVVSFAMRAPGLATGFRSTRRASSASVVKAMLLVAYLNRPDVRKRPLNSDELALLGPMIRYSDNLAANRVSAIVGVQGLARLAGAAKMRTFEPSPVWGGSQITAADQARFFERIDDRVARRHRPYAMRLLRSIIPGQRWGVGRARPAGWTLYFKGGWFPGANAVDHQVALLKRGRRRVALAVLISNSPSSAYANETIRGVTVRLLRGINRRPKAVAGPAKPRGLPTEVIPAVAGPSSMWSFIQGAAERERRQLLGLPW